MPDQDQTGKRSKLLRVAVWILCVVLAISIYCVASKPAEPLDHLQGLVVRDDHKMVDNTYFRLIKVANSPEAACAALQKALAGKLTFTKTKTKITGDYGEFNGAIRGVDYKILITPSSAENTLITEMRRATFPETVASNVDDFFVSLFQKGRA